MLISQRRFDTIQRNTQTDFVFRIVNFLQPILIHNNNINIRALKYSQLMSIVPNLFLTIIYSLFLSLFYFLIF